jgi:acyl-CoA synthetase (AMP-forming)/AMP-acid ligase II/thioesterase domain-containing protein
VSAVEGHTVVDAWRSAALRYPGACAIRDESGSSTYRQLQQRANGWSAAISALPPGSGNVAINLPHNAGIIAAVIGVLAAGRCVVALDPDQPLDWRLAQLRFAEANILLANENDALALRTAGWTGEIITVETVQPNEIDFGIAIKPESRARLSFTSGSSGEPKAVVASHRTISFAVECLQAIFTLTSADRHALLTPVSIPATLPQIFATLGAGATLCLFEARRRTLSEIARCYEREAITTTQLVPPLLRSLAGEAAGGKLWPYLRAAKLGGDNSMVSDARLFAACSPQDAVLINGLGLSETGFNVCWWQWQSDYPLGSDFLPIGRPPKSVEVVVETSPGVAATGGEVGEIVVHSAALADGYWRDAKRTAATYRASSRRPGWRELRTGDLGCWRADGLLEHRGRLDDVIKIRGHRVVPAEVEAALCTIEEVITATVLAKDEPDGTRLYAFAQVRAGSTWDASKLRHELGRKLPDYMVPAQISIVDSLPLLPGGKVDRKILLADAQRPSPRAAIEPRDPLERTLHALFRRVFPRQVFGITDSFFDLGGDSLKAAELFTGITKLLRVELPLTDLKMHPTVEQLAAHIRSSGWNLTDHPVILLTPKPAADAVNLFSWVGAGSDVMILCDLARHLGSRIALYGIQHRGTDGRHIYDLSVEAMAQRGTELVRRAQPNGPYALCGSSFGGVIALEVARRLRDAGEAVSFLALLDTYGPGYPALPRRLRLSDFPPLALRLWRRLGEKDESAAKLLWDGVRERVRRPFVRRLIHRPAPRATPLSIKKRFLLLQEVCLFAKRHYLPQTYEGAVHLFRVERPPPLQIAAPDEWLGWRPWLSGCVHLEQVPGRHISQLHEPHVETLAMKLRGALFQERKAGD